MLKDTQIVDVSEEKLEQYKANGYNEDVLPKLEKDRKWTTFNYFTLWMGVVHNIPNYTAILGFLLLGLKPISVILAVALTGLTISLVLTINGKAGTKFGIPFSMHLRSVYGSSGAKLPGFLRGVVAAIAWFGVQTYIGATVLTILISKIWPSYLAIGGGAEILGISIPNLISFMIFWIGNMAIGLGGGEILSKFTAILSPIIYIVFGAMTVWAMRVGGGLGNILNTRLSDQLLVNPGFAYLMIIASSLGVWAAPAVSVSDFTQLARSEKDQRNGQIGGVFIGYLVFAFMAVIISVGGTIRYGVPSASGAVLDFINQWDSVPAIIISTGVFLLTTVSTNAATNIIPAGLQLSALFPRKINNRSGVWIAGIASILIQPWRLMSGEGAILMFLNLIGALLGPVAGVMIANYFFIDKEEIDLDELYFDTNDSNVENRYNGSNIQAYIATIVGLILSIIGNFIPVLKPLSDIAWIVGFASAFVIYLILSKLMPSEKVKV